MKLLSENIKPKRQQDCLVLQSIESSYRKKSNFDFLSICFSSYFASNLSLRINLHKLYTLQSGSRPPPSTNLHFHTLELFWPKYHYYRKRLQNLQIGPTSKLPAPHFLLRYFIVCWFAAQPWATSSLGGGNFWGKKQAAAKQGGKRAKMPRDDSGFTAVTFSLFPTFWCTHKPNSQKSVKRINKYCWEIQLASERSIWQMPADHIVERSASLRSTPVPWWKSPIFWQPWRADENKEWLKWSR